MDGKALAARLSKKYDTRDPFRLADEMGFIVVFAPLVGMRGFQQRIKRQNSDPASARLNQEVNNCFGSSLPINNQLLKLTS